MLISGSDYIAAFLARVGVRHVFALTGGACAFMIDAVGRHPALELVAMHNEQAAAMAADAIWRVDRRLGVTMATSGPGATNLITGIACSYFDSIPTLHITGQVNQNEAGAVHGAAIRQCGFQETKIVEMVRPITKYAVMVRTTDELRDELARCHAIALEGRMGPVLLDVPMDVQQAMMEADLPEPAAPPAPGEVEAIAAALGETFAAARRPIVLWGGGVAMAGAEHAVAEWLAATGLPFVAISADFDDALTMGDGEALIERLETQLRAAEPMLASIYIRPEKQADAKLAFARNANGLG